ncbi:hypothetical protein RJ640_013712 [Escallonia rubra]|uniref:Uncharacterized protein n=1 Tax=Escallonia rubra TaxID=112253 RepID=A0AA88QE22_9ASTE|nr:hypothetical protein RJ640_013712 [Escallonia rubra]
MPPTPPSHPTPPTLAPSPPPGETIPFSHSPFPQLEIITAPPSLSPSIPPTAPSPPTSPAPVPSLPPENTTLIISIHAAHDAFSSYSIHTHTHTFSSG